MKRIVISDTHIGSEFYRSQQLLEFLRTESFDELILAGDIIDFIKIPVFTNACLDIIKTIGEHTNVIYIIGNHDESLENLIGSKFREIQFMRKYEFISNQRKFRIEHGDRFSTGFINAATFIKIISVFHHMLEKWLKIDLTSWWVRRQIRKHKLRSISAILSDNDDVDVFIMGHTHIPEAVIWVNADQTIKTYVNSGDWVTHQTYVEIIDGQVRLKTFSNSHHSME